MSDDVLIEQLSHLGILTLNRPEALNALTLSMIKTLRAQLLAWLSDSSIHAVIIRSAGGKAFCAGGDVRRLYETGKTSLSAVMPFFAEEYALNQLIHHYSKPYIALMDGITMGGGAGVSLHGSHPVASDSFSFAMPETSIGFFPDIGASYLLSRCPKGLGNYLGLTGSRLNANEACGLGLVRYMIQASEFQSVMDALIATDLSTDASARVSACLDTFARPINNASLVALQSKVESCFNHSSLGDILSALEHSNDVFHQEILDVLSQKSPMSLCVTMIQLQKAVAMSFDECMQMDACLVAHFMTGHDFYEGVRALLIDKDKAPKWVPSVLSKIDDGQVAAYFL